MNEKVDIRMLVLARESRGATQQFLVDRIPSLDQGNYSKMEKGMLNVPEETLLKIANLLDYPVSFFYKKAVNTPISSFYYRKRITVPKKDLAILEAKFDVIRLMVDELLDSVTIPEFKIPQYEINERCSPSDVGRKLREFFKLPKGPVKDFIKRLESCGVIVFFINTDVEKFDGITLLTDKGQPIIFINESLSNDRKIYTIVHETIHLVCHIPFSPLAPDRDEEKEANEATAEVLMPLLEIRHQLQNLNYAKLSVLKNFWGVSKAALVYRAHHINAITHSRYTNLNIELSRHGEKKKESGYVDLEEPILFNLILSTYENAMSYSLEDLLSLLSINKRDYFEYFNKSKYGVEVTPKKIIDINTSRA